MPVRPPTFRPSTAAAPAMVTPRQKYDAERGSARSRGYTFEWDKSSRRFRDAHPLCLGCEAVGRVEFTTVTDHTVPHKGDSKLFWDPDNRQPACDWHHDTIKQMLEAEYAKGNIPASELALDSETAKALTRKLLGG